MGQGQFTDDAAQLDLGALSAGVADEVAGLTDEGEGGDGAGAFEPLMAGVEGGAGGVGGLGLEAAQGGNGEVGESGCGDKVVVAEESKRGGEEEATGLVEAGGPGERVEGESGMTAGGQQGSAIPGEGSDGVEAGGEASGSEAALESQLPGSPEEILAAAVEGAEEEEVEGEGVVGRLGSGAEEIGGRAERSALEEDVVEEAVEVVQGSAPDAPEEGDGELEVEGIELEPPGADEELGETGREIQSKRVVHGVDRG